MPLHEALPRVNPPVLDGRQEFSDELNRIYVGCSKPYSGHLRVRVICRRRLPGFSLAVNDHCSAFMIKVSGGKLATQLIHELRRRGGGMGLVTMCVGGGMGAAGIFEVYGA